MLTQQSFEPNTIEISYFVSLFDSLAPAAGLKPATKDYLYGSSVFLILLSIFYLSMEAMQVVRRRKQYLTEGENYVQVLTFIFSMIFVSGFGNKCWCAPSWQWQFGALARLSSLPGSIWSSSSKTCPSQAYQSTCCSTFASRSWVSCFCLCSSSSPLPCPSTCCL